MPACRTCSRHWHLPLIVSLAPLLAGCKNQSPTGSSPPTEPATVELVRAKLVEWPRTIRIQGGLIGDEQAVVGVEVAGQVREVRVDLGSRVRKGDPLCVLDTEELELKVKQAESQLAQVRARLGLKPSDTLANLKRERAPNVVQERAHVEEARANLDRTRKLVKSGSATEEELHQRRAALDVAEARLASAIHAVDEQIALFEVYSATLRLAQRALQDATVKAPFDGVVASRHVAPGVFLQVGNPVVTLVRIDPLRFRGQVPERHAAQVRLGEKVSVRVEGESMPLEGEITRISPLLEASSRSLAVEVDLANPGGRLRAGLFAEAEIVVDPQARTLVVPTSALVEFAGVEKVWLIKDGRASMQRVQTGRRRAGQVEILSGLTAGTEVARDGRSARVGPVVVVEEKKSVASVE